jgi:hypothetical protein
MRPQLSSASLLRGGNILRPPVWVIFKECPPRDPKAFAHRLNIAEILNCSKIFIKNPPLQRKR